MRDNQNDDRQALLDQILSFNEVIAVLSERLDEEELRSPKIEEEGEILTTNYFKMNSIRSIRKGKVIRLVTPISQSSLFTGSNYEPNMFGKLKKNMTADSIEMLVSFIKCRG